MKRHIFEQLSTWQQSQSRKPLLLMGARQVGKTYILKEFGKVRYQKTVYLNFEQNPRLKKLFAEQLSAKEIIKFIAIEINQEISPPHTLLIFDEIQECPEALNSLKYFYEETPEYHICAAGSLLGVKLIHVKGFPVGKVNFLHLYPLCFMEFLEALGEDKLTQYLMSLDKVQTIPENLHEKLLLYFKQYLFVGGMPEAVKEFIKHQNMQQVRVIHQEILQAYSLDFAKHAPANMIMKINQIWESIPAQLAKENKKFIYSVIRTGARAKEFEAALQWLTEANLINKVTHITTPKLPIDAYCEFNFFKIYLLDVGLLGAMTNLSEKILIDGDALFQEFKGIFVENYVAQELTKQQQKLYYWTSQNTAEIDFIYQYENKIYPLEVKSGYSEKKQSLRVYREKYQPALSIRTSPMNLTLDGDILNIPLYLLSQLSDLL